MPDNIMISRLRGELASKSADHVVVDVQGVGYQVFVSNITLTNLPVDGVTVSLYIHTHVREDQIALFGFATAQERALFLRLLGVSSIGPKLALAVLSKMSPHELVHAVASEDLVRLSAIPGIGKKTAERIVVDLKDRLMRDHADLLQLPMKGGPRNGLNEEAISALCNLGYTRQIAERTLAAIDVNQPHSGGEGGTQQALPVGGATQAPAIDARGEKPLESILRLALKELARVQ